MIALQIVIAMFATWRLSYMVTSEEGPWRVFFHLKNALGAYDLDEKGTPRTWVGRGIICMYCVSFWVGLFFSLPMLAKWEMDRLILPLVEKWELGWLILFLLVIWELGWLLLALPFAISAGALYLNRIIRRE